MARKAGSGYHGEWGLKRGRPGVENDQETGVRLKSAFCQNFPRTGFRFIWSKRGIKTVHQSLSSEVCLRLCRFLVRGRSPAVASLGFV